MAFTNTAPLTVDTTNNNVTFSTVAGIEVLAATASDGAINRAAVIFNGTTAYNANPFAGLQFGVNMSSAGGLTGACGIASGKANASDGDTASFLAFYTRANGASVVEAARFSPAARFLIGSTSDDGSNLLQVNGSAKFTGAGNFTSSLQIGSASTNELTIAGNTTGNSPTITASGGDSNISIQAVQKGAAPFVSSTGFRGKRTTVADTIYSVLASDWIVAYTSLTAPRTVTLFAPAAGNVGQEIIIADESGNAGTQTITIASASGSVLGVSTITSNYGQVRLYSNGTNWYGK